MKRFLLRNKRLLTDLRACKEEKRMRKYERPFLQVITFEAKDIVTLSEQAKNEQDVLFDAEGYFSNYFGNH